MSTLNISLPDVAMAFVDEPVSGRRFGTSSEYIRKTIRKDQDRQYLRGLLVDGAASVPTEAVDKGYFDRLRDRVRLRAAK